MLSCKFRPYGCPCEVSSCRSESHIECMRVLRAPRIEWILTRWGNQCLDEKSLEEHLKMETEFHLDMTLKALEAEKAAKELHQQAMTCECGVSWEAEWSIMRLEVSVGLCVIAVISRWGSMASEGH